MRNSLLTFYYLPYDVKQYANTFTICLTMWTSMLIIYYLPYFVNQYATICLNMWTSMLIFYHMPYYVDQYTNIFDSVHNISAAVSSGLVSGFFYCT